MRLQVGDGVTTNRLEGRRVQRLVIAQILDETQHRVIQVLRLIGICAGFIEARTEAI